MKTGTITGVWEENEKQIQISLIEQKGRKPYAS